MNLIKIQQEMIKRWGKGHQVVIDPKENHYMISFNKISFYRIPRSNFILNDLFFQKFKISQICDSEYFYTVDSLDATLLGDDTVFIAYNKKTGDRFAINWVYFKPYGIKREDYNWHISEKGLFVGINEYQQICCGALAIRRY